MINNSESRDIKISVILATNRLNSKVLPYVKQFEKGLSVDAKEIFNSEFLELARDRVKDSEHYLEPTLRSMAKQKFKDIEFIISHRYPEDAKDIVNKYKDNLNVKLVKEKPSIWHELGDKYHTVANNKNTGFINSSGELIYHIDDLSFFNNNLLGEAWNLWKDDKYVTGRTIRCITFREDLKEPSIIKCGPNKYQITNNGWIGQRKSLVNKEDYPVIPMNMFWTCSASVSAKELLEINGYDEIWDGSLAGIDMDAGTRLSYISDYERVASNVFLYEIEDPTPKYITRDDVMFRVILRDAHIKANSWKPTISQMRRYENWHKRNIGQLDPNWNKFMDVPIYNIERIKND